MDLRPIWLMSPLSVSDTLPLDPELFDVVIFDEASQIPLEEAVPALYRSHQNIVVGDQMQLPPTQFFSASGESDDDETDPDGNRFGVTLDADSFLAQSDSALPSTMLSWHYRSRSEALIGFSNAAFYGGRLATVPDKNLPAGDLGEIIVNDPVVDAATGVDALLRRSVSFHKASGIYEARRNATEATYIAELVRELLRRNTGQTIGVVAFSQAQQSAIEEALDRLAAADPDFARLQEEEEIREDDGQFCGLFIKNLENVQGDERDIIIMSVCYAPAATGRMVMNFGPINQRGGEKRLNVIFSRAKRHMALVSSINHSAITNEYNDGANALRRFIQYAEATSKGDTETANLVLRQINGERGGSHVSTPPPANPIVRQLADALRAKGHVVDLDVGRSRFRCDLAIRGADQAAYALGVLVDTDERISSATTFERVLTHPVVMRAFDWHVAYVLGKDWQESPERVLRDIEAQL